MSDVQRPTYILFDLLTCHHLILSNHCCHVRRLQLTNHATELNTEYIFGLFSTLATSGQFSLLGVPTSYDISHFAAEQNIVSVAVIVNFYFAQFDMTVPFEIDVWVSTVVSKLLTWRKC